MSEPGDAPRPRGRTALRWLRVHAGAFTLVVVSLNVINVMGGAPWWAFWPSMTWGLVLAVHFFIVKALTIDEGWVQERAMELREHSYDFDHMRDIERRIVEDDFSVVPRGERGAHDNDTPRGERGAPDDDTPRGERGAPDDDSPPEERGARSNDSPRGERGTREGNTPREARARNVDRGEH